VCMSNRCTGGALDSCRVSRCPCLLSLLHVVACPGAAPHMQEVGVMNASHTWHMHGK
jgi:hypothetical protein